MNRTLLLVALVSLGCGSGRAGHAIDDLDPHTPSSSARDLDAGTGSPAPAVAPTALACGTLHTGRVAAIPIPPGGLGVRPGTPPGALLASGYAVVANRLYDASTDTWSEPLPSPAHWSMVADCLWLAGDRMACFGGNHCGMTSCSSVPSARAVAIDAATFALGAMPDMHHGRFELRAGRMPDGRIVVSGQGAEVYDPITATWTDFPLSATWTVSAHSVTPLDGDRVLIAGGFEPSAPGTSKSNARADAEVLDLTTGARTPSSMHEPRADHGAVRMTDGRVLIVGGMQGDRNALTPTSSAEIYDPATSTWHAAAPYPHAAYDVLVVPLACGGALAIGGFEDVDRAFDEAWTYDPATDRWTFALRMQHGRAGRNAVFLSDGSLLVSGGASIESALSAERLFVE